MEGSWQKDSIEGRFRQRQENKIREVGQKLQQELNELPSINYEMMRERNGVIKRE